MSGHPRPQGVVPVVTGGVIFVNPASGPADDTATLLAQHFTGADIREVEGADLVEQVAAAAAGASFVGVAGGDGTIRCAAGALAGGPVPLLPIPAGTRNHFAKAVGLATFDDAAAAAARRSTRTVDLGMVNGEAFVNNASIGVYPLIVRTRKPIEARLPKWLATLVATWRQARTLHRVPVTVDGGPMTPAWMVFVGNGCYGTNVFQATERADLAQGSLDVRICHADGRLSRLRAVGALLFGRLDRSPMVTRRTAESVVIDTTAAVDVALDGEVLRLRSPLHFQTQPGALTVYCAPAD